MATWYANRSSVEGLAIVLNRLGMDADEGPDYVFVHGLGVSSRYFEDLAAELAPHGKIWLVDLAGYGSSPKPPRGRDVTIDDHARVLGIVLDAAGITTPVLVGHSMGCQVVSKLAAQRPQLSDRLVLLSPTINPARRSRWMQFFDLLRDFWREPPRADAFGLYSYFFTGRVRYYLKQIPHMISDPVEQRLAVIKTRTLVINGERDPIVPQVWAEQVVRLLDHGRLEIVPGAHVIMYTAPREIAALMRGFVA
jgi:pimeloyl-ACP methyl ester carboxylesterase